MNRIMKRFAVPLAAAAVLGTTGFAYMAGNTVPETHAGDGQAAISGYTVSDVHYQIDPKYIPTTGTDANGGRYAGNYPIESVSFTLDHPAHTVYATIFDTAQGGRAGGGRSYGNCTSDDTYHWVCAFSGGTNHEAITSDATGIEVAAAQ